MFPKPKSALVPNTYAFESEPMVKPTGFREYDARWLFNKEINLMGVQALGMGLGALIAELGVKQEIVTGHDFRGYSASIKMALITGLMSAGVKVQDIGLAVTPMAYFGQFDLDVPCVAMVTASHNDNGWTGVKMGANRPLTFGPDRPEGERTVRTHLHARPTVVIVGSRHHCDARHVEIELAEIRHRRDREADVLHLDARAHQPRDQRHLDRGRIAAEVVA